VHKISATELQNLFVFCKNYTKKYGEFELWDCIAKCVMVFLQILFKHESTNLLSLSYKDPIRHPCPLSKNEHEMFLSEFGEFQLWVDILKPLYDYLMTNKQESLNP